jgi:hypothetical protein
MRGDEATTGGPVTTAPTMTARLGVATDDRVTVDVDGPRGGGVLEFTSPDAVWSAPPPNLDFAAIGLVHLAAATGCDLVLEGPASRAQLDRLDEYVMIWSIWRPDVFRRIRVVAEEEVDTTVPPDRRGAAMGFSGGVDASFALAAHTDGALGRLSRRIDLGVLVVGWDLRHGDEAALRRARASAARALDAYGVELAVVATNWQQDFCDAWFMSFNSGLMSILHTFSASHSAAIHATDHDYRDELRMPPYGSKIAINHLLGNESFPVISTGGTHGRMERLEFLREHPVLLEDLRVCYQADAGGTNCGHCEKCLRTQLAMRAVGLPTEPSFPSPCQVDDVSGATVTRASILMHYDRILGRLSPDDEMYAPVAAWLERERLARAPRIRELTERVDDLERQLAGSRAELEGLLGSRSWQITRPVRATTGWWRSRGRPR